jgi:hypothetical protein
MRLSRNLVTITISYLALLIAAVAVDYLLHRSGRIWIGRYLGIAGFFLLTSSFIYSWQKRKRRNWKRLKWILRYHEFAGWLGALMILVHAGIHFNAVLPWLAIAGMLIVTASGHWGRYLMRMNPGFGNETISESASLNRWRLFHIPFVLFFVLMAIWHVLTIMFFWNWR